MELHSESSYRFLNLIGKGFSYPFSLYQQLFWNRHSIYLRVKTYPPFYRPCSHSVMEKYFFLDCIVSHDDVMTWFGHCKNCLQNLVQVFRLDQSRAEVFKTRAYCSINWLGCKCCVYTFPLHATARSLVGLSGIYDQWKRDVREALFARKLKIMISAGASQLGMSNEW